MKERVFFEEFDSLYYFHGSSYNWEMQGFHFHDQYEIILFLTDGAMLEIGDQIYHVTAGDLFFINNKEYHRTSSRSKTSYKRYVLMFDPELLIRAGQVLHYDFACFFENRVGDFNHMIHLPEEHLKKVEKLFGRIESSISAPKSQEATVKTELAILELVVNLNELYKFFAKKEENISEAEREFKDPVLYRDRIEQIKKYIADNVSERLELEDLAREFYMSRYYLSHYFKSETGFTLKQYVTNQKIMAAKAMLCEGFSVTEVAARLSYKTDSHFISVFKRITGITPKKYVQSQKEQEILFQ